MASSGLRAGRVAGRGADGFDLAVLGGGDVESFQFTLLDERPVVVKTSKQLPPAVVATQGSRSFMVVCATRDAADVLLERARSIRKETSW